MANLVAGADLRRGGIGNRRQVEGSSATSAELALRTGAHQGALSRLLRALANVGILVESPSDHFTLSAPGQTLRGYIQESTRAIARIAGPFRARPWSEVVHSVRTVETAFPEGARRVVDEYLSSHPDEGSVFVDAMSCLSKLDASAVAAVYGFTSVDIAGDVGGGQGTFLAEIIGLPAAFGDIIVHRGKLQRECLLVMSRDSGVESGPHDPLAKNLSGNGLLKTLILQGF